MPWRWTCHQSLTLHGLHRHGAWRYICLGSRDCRLSGRGSNSFNSSSTCLIVGRMMVGKRASAHTLDFQPFLFWWALWGTWHDIFQKFDQMEYQIPLRAQIFIAFFPFDRSEARLGLGMHSFVSVGWDWQWAPKPHGWLDGYDWRARNPHWWFGRRRDRGQGQDGELPAGGISAPQ